MMNLIPNTHHDEPAETFEDLRRRVHDRFEDLSPHLQRVARLMLDQPNEVALQTIAAIAERLEVQPSTLIRFAKTFGYNGFSRMQQIFKLRLIEGGAGNRERVYVELEASGDPSNVSVALNSCIDTLMTSLESLRENIHHDDLERAVELCLSARHIYIAGLRRSRPIAAYLAYGLTRLERHCSLLDFGGGMATQQVANMGHEDLLFAMSFTPYSPPVVDVVRDAHFQGLPIITMTDTFSSPLASNSAIVFCVDNEATGQFRPISGAIGLVQAIIVSLGAQSQSTR